MGFIIVYVQFEGLTMIDYDNWLLDYFEIAQEKNPSFSLRAFAKKLDLSPGLLSQLLNGKKEITYETALKLVDRLKINSNEAMPILSHYYNLKLRSDSTKRDIIDLLSESELLTFKECELDLFEHENLFGWKARLIFNKIPLEWSEFSKIKEDFFDEFKLARTEFDKIIAELEKADLILTKEDKVVRCYNNYVFKAGQEPEVKKKIKEIQSVYNSQQRLTPGTEKKKQVVKLSSEKAQESFHISCTFPNLDENELEEFKILVDELTNNFSRLGAITDTDSKFSRPYFTAVSIIEM